MRWGGKRPESSGSAALISGVDWFGESDDLGAFRGLLRVAWVVMQGVGLWVRWLWILLWLPVALLTYWATLLVVLLVVFLIAVLSCRIGRKRIIGGKISLWPDTPPFGRQALIPPRTRVIRTLGWYVARRR